MIKAMPALLSRIVLLVRASLVAQTIKNLPALLRARVRSLGWEDPTCCRATKPACHNCALEPRNSNC